MNARTLRRYSWGDCDDPTLVLVHGLTEAGSAWPDAVARWAADWRVVAVDQRGHGDSPRFDDAALNSMFGTFVADLVAVLEEEGPAVLVGHSLGGRVSAAAALARPDLVRGLLLEDPALTNGAVTPEGFIPEQLRFLATFRDGGVAEKRRMREVTAWTPEEIDAWADCKALVDERMIAYLDLGDLDAAETYNALIVPTLVVYDADGPLAIPAEQVTNPLVRLMYLDGVSHCIRRDDPARFHGICDSWLRDVAARSG